MIQMKLVGPKGIQSLSGLPEALKNQLFNGMQDGARLIERTSKTKYLTGPYPDKLSVDRGLLRQGVWAYAGISAIPGEFGRIIAKSQQWYGTYVHERKGADDKPIMTPFIIKAKKQRGMTFFWMRKGVWVHGAMLVKIPSRPFLYPAILDTFDDIKQLLNKMIKQAYKQVGGKGTP